ncbi:phosphomethylpyrimidine synthase ThiC [Desulfobaculum bizertense]|uniref:Phosphomethylpyrimidine synthase n=1 Tax=Desulfobaculum bizertense DSM 18034 TaxID=1121442 RepID=A0A1T4VG70_9BACT|nr:phosphomethylpyrimidine synthase ThiC [Desulfobaculum bizertense]UIJ37697.1 phosphomethylpyrimidine synthase ThiC [Desulfobaculum bizertense]SKA63531.1 hydroxymethylpyrimidine synthase [Desulfobaculum bizertense DSM 18034]
MTYTTQMDAARKGIVTEQIKTVAEKENMRVDDLMAKLAKGTCIIPCNKNHHSIVPEGVGEGMRTKVNVNLGISKDANDVELELDKVRHALRLGAESIMDLSCFGKTQEFRSRLVEISPAMIGTVPMYDAVGFYDKELKDISTEEFFKVVERHVEDGVDFLTIHAGLNRAAAERIRKNERITSIVSRGGSLLYAWMEQNDKENPFYEHYDRLLDICEKHDVTLSLGDGCRPGCLADSTDAAQVEELITLGELTKRAWERNVQVMIEGPGHMCMDEIPGNVMMEKRLCHGAPFYVLGPLVTDIAPGYDHITAAIGGAIAAAAGADFLCYVTPAEHLRLPDLDDMKEGIIATQIAAHAADMAKKIPGSRDRDNAMARARADFDWCGQFGLALDPERPREYRQASQPEVEDSCSMCGKMCAMRTMKRVREGKDLGMAK